VGRPPDAAPRRRSLAITGAPALTIVCLHGLGRSAADWDGVRGGLEAFGDVLAPELAREPAEARRRAGAAIAPGSIVVGHSLGGVLALQLAGAASRAPRAVILTGCFFPPARNGRTAGATARDYVAHRVAYVGSLERRGAGRESRAGTARALASLVSLTIHRRRFDATIAAIRCPVLVLHTRDDHHVPFDFAAAAARSASWDLRVLDRGGHHAHVVTPEAWIDAVGPWLSSLR
jgi:pimeloyl-ACP methyl ester carboxylesterase